MTFQFEDFSEGGSSNRNKVACLLGDKCKHASEEECDQYRQQLLEAEHKKGCDELKVTGICPHFDDPKKGVPQHARFQGMNPDEYLIWARGKRNA